MAPARRHCEPEGSVTAASLGSFATTSRDSCSRLADSVMSTGTRLTRCGLPEAHPPSASAHRQAASNDWQRARVARPVRE
ncbi:hypothetical protein WJ978_20840 [Achromobacter xylosoxidans]